jgi:hypothetical protein
MATQTSGAPIDDGGSITSGKQAGSDGTTGTYLPTSTNTPSPVVSIFPGGGKAGSPRKSLLMLEFMLLALVYALF